MRVSRVVPSLLYPHPVREGARSKHRRRFLFLVASRPAQPGQLVMVHVLLALGEAHPCNGDYPVAGGSFPV